MRKRFGKKLGALLLCASVAAGSCSAHGYVDAAAQENTAASAQEEDSEEETQEEAAPEENPAAKEEKEEIEEKETESETEAEQRESEEKEREAEKEEEKDETEKEKQGTVSENPAGQDISVSGNDKDAGSEEQYHFVEEDYESIEKWLSLYCPNGYEELFSQEDDWWENLYDYEKEYAEFLTGLIVELSGDVYDGQEFSECIEIIENGVFADSFFAGTVFRNLTVEDLKTLFETGYSLADLESFLSAALWEEESALFTEYMESDTENGALNILAKIAKKAAAPFVSGRTYALSDGDLVAKASVSSTGYTGINHGTIYKITIGGVPGLCLSHGKRCRSSFLYNVSPDACRKKTGRIAYFVDHAQVSGKTYAACQVAAWIFQESGSYNEAQVESRAKAIVDIPEEQMDSLMSYIWSFYLAAKSYTGDYYEVDSDSNNAQTIGVPEIPPGTPYTVPEAEPEVPEPAPDESVISETVDVNYKIEVYKRDWQTDVGLAGCEVELSEDGEYLGTVFTDENGYAEFEVEAKSKTFTASYDGVTKTEEQAKAEIAEQTAAFQAMEYTYSCVEITAPTGYVWEANEQEETLSGGGTVTFELTNERTLGAVELIKYDTESECGVKQGDATLNGAVYGIYAAEDIIHQDGKTGVLFRAGDLVQTATVGKSPKQNGDGYLLNTGGKRYIESGGKLAYEDTPGRTLFGDLELGSYYVKEITPAEGYMLDEAVYPVTFTYKWQMTTVETRDENAGGAENELTADDGSTSKTIYSGDYVDKQGIQFVKTSDNTYQTELVPIEGAGFSVYLISELSGVRDGSIRPIGESWTADDIMTFYEYDFTKEQTATLYKRTDHEEWTEGDKLWLTPGEKPNEYRVKEMFTDADGRIVTPELPYGTYVIVETTTPEHHVCAKPFIVYITQDGGVLYTDKTKQKIEKTYTPEEGIRYGDHAVLKEREGRLLQKQRIINNTITKAFLRVLKADEEFTVIPGTYIEAEEFVRGTVLKEGAEYRLKCLTLAFSRESLTALNWKFDEDGYMSYYDPNAKKMTGTSERPFQTTFLRDQNDVISDSYITLPQEVPVGTYELEELTAPEGYVVNGSEQTIEDTISGRVNGYEVKETPHEKLIFTINNGAVYPDGQMGTNKFALQDEYGNLTVTVLQENQEQKGVIEIYKHGEQAAGTHKDEETLLDKLKREPFREIKQSEEALHQDLVFEYEDAPIEGARFDIIAAEDIYTQEVQKELFEQYSITLSDYLIHNEGDIVASVTTDRNGWGYAAGLYIGKYIIKETTAGDGFVLNTMETEFEITPQEQTVSFDFHTADYKNERQKLEITVTKQDADSGEALAGAVYGLYAAEDLSIHIEQDAESGKWIVRDTPGILCPADTLIATCITDEDGRGVFDEDLPLGKYYVRELEGPVGYLTALDDISLDGSYAGEKGGQETKVQEHTVTFQNKKTQAVITKQDIASGKEIAGARLEIKEIMTDEEGNLLKDASGEYRAETVLMWFSKEEGEEIHYFYQEDDGYLIKIDRQEDLPAGKDLITKEGHLIEGLQIGRVYILSEREAPYGYGYAEDILFKLIQEEKDGKLTEFTALYSKDGENWERPAEDILIMFDEKEALKVEKSTIQMTQWGDDYQYTIDEIRNLTEETLENFTVTDYLPKGICLTELWTGTYNESLLYDVEYQLNNSGEWVSWESGLSTQEDHHLAVPENLLTQQEHISRFRLCFGTVGGGFGKEASPVFFTRVLNSAYGELINKIELTAEQNGRLLRDKDETLTILYLKNISGYSARGGGAPLYEIVETDQEVKEKAIFMKRQWEQETQEREQEKIPEPERDVSDNTPHSRTGTGDNAPVGMLLLLFGLAGAGLVILLCVRRRWYGREKEEEGVRK